MKFISGGGLTVEDGSIIQLKIVESDDGPIFEKGWYILAEGAVQPARP